MNSILSSIQTHFLALALIFPAIILHEVAHGYVAYLLGDPTAKRAGRLTLNPIPHVDLWGTILMPTLLLILSGGRFAIGYAKPVPINTHYFKNERLGMLLTGIAGPVTNIILGLVVGFGVRIAIPIAPPSAEWLVVNLVLFCQLDLMLAFFNLIPIPPLDGSRVLQMFLPDGLRDAYHRFERYGFLVVFGLLYFAPGILSTYLSYTSEPLLRWILGM